MGVVTFFVNFFEALKPFIVGFFLAYILSVPCSNIEKRLLKHVQPKYASVLSVLIVEVCFFCVFLVTLILFLPLCIDSISKIIQNLPTYLKTLRSLASDKFGDTSFVLNHLYVSNLMDDLLNMLGNKLSSDATTLFNQVYEGLLVLSNKIVAFILTIVVNVFILIDRHKVSKGIKTIIATFIPKFSDKILHGIVRINQVFRKFILGKAIDSCIIGVFSIIVFLIFRMPYALFSSIVIGITNMIPIVGPIIGAIPGLLLIVGESPSKAIGYILLVLAIQQLDGHIIGPKCIGNVTGLNTTGVLFAVFMGGKLFGIIGMFLGVPVCAVLYETFVEYMEVRQKGQEIEDTIKKEDTINIE